MKNNLINIEFECPSCGLLHSVQLPIKLYQRVINRYQSGELIQNILKDYPPEFREKFITGYCDSCIERIFTFYE